MTVGGTDLRHERRVITGPAVAVRCPTGAAGRRNGAARRRNGGRDAVLQWC